METKKQGQWFVSKQNDDKKTTTALSKSLGSSFWRNTVPRRTVAVKKEGRRTRARREAFPPLARARIPVFKHLYNQNSTFAGRERFEKRASEFEVEYTFLRILHIHNMSGVRCYVSYGRILLTDLAPGGWSTITLSDVDNQHDKDKNEVNAK